MKGGIVFTLIIFICVCGFAQTSTSESVETKKFSYSFTGEASQLQLNQVQLHMQQIKGIADVKAVYKSDSKSGIIYFSFIAYVATGENESAFNAADIKTILIEAGLIPYEFKEL